MESLLQDLRYALRNFRQSPGFTFVALLTLTLGIGANTAIFTVVKSVLFEPLPFPEPERLVVVLEKNIEKGYPQFALSPLNFRDYHDQNQVFEAMAASTAGSLALTGDGAPQQIRARRVTGEYFQVFGVQPALGRALEPDDDQPGAPPVAVLGHGFWENRFGADPEIQGRDLTLNGESYTVIGVMPPGFIAHYDVFVPLALAYEETGRGGHWLRGSARLKAGVTVEQARANLEQVAAGLEQTYPDSNTGWSSRIDPLHERMVENVESALFILLAAVGLVLLIACANVANLSLSRMALRERELALRTALGASRGRLMRQMLTESVLLSLAGGLCGFVLARRGTELLVALSADNLPRSAEIAVDTDVLLFTLVLAAVTGLVFGLLPALKASSPNLQGSLKEGGRNQAGGGSHRLRGLLVRAEVAVALVLLIGAGLLIRSFQTLLEVDPGFDPTSKLMVELELPESRYPGDPERAAFYRQLFERLEGLPGVEQAAAVNPAPLTGSGFQLTFAVEGRPIPKANQEPVSHVRSASPGYFETMGIPVDRGRTMTLTDDGEAVDVIVINRSAARQFWPDEDPLGTRLTFGDPENEEAQWWTVIGVVGDVRHRSLEGETDPEMYWPFLQQPLDGATLVLKTAVDAASVVGPLRDEIAALDSDMPIFEVRTMDDLLSEAVAQPRFNSLLLSLFAGVAMLLAVIGVYGLISYSVTQRLREIGVRLALGAGRQAVLSLVFRQGMGPVLAGIGLGIAVALAGTRVLRSLVYQVSPTDPTTFAFTTMLLVLVGACACFIPAWRATRVDPIVALRDE